MKSEWKKCNLGSTMNFKNGKKRPSSTGRIPVYGGNGILDFTDQYNNEDCVVIGRVGAYCGSVFRESSKCWVSDNAICGTAREDNDIDYLYYLLKFLRLNERHIGTGQPLLTQEILNNIEILCPPLRQQKNIGKFLRTLDDKITLNNKINENLEQQAQALYREMFLENQNITTVTKTLNGIAVITMGQSPSGKSYNEDGIGEVFYQGRAEFGTRFPTRRLFTTEPKRMAEAGDVLLSVRAPVGDLNVAYEKCCIGRGLAAVHSKIGNNSFILYTMMASKPRFDVFNSEGTVFGSINRESLNTMPIEVPPMEMIVKFEDMAHPIDEMIRIRYEENCRLETLRDTLLPKLMNREIDIEDVI